jgi:hypothetical protein
LAQSPFDGNNEKDIKDLDALLFGDDDGDDDNITIKSNKPEFNNVNSNLDKSTSNNKSLDILNAGSAKNLDALLFGDDYEDPLFKKKEAPSVPSIDNQTNNNNSNNQNQVNANNNGQTNLNTDAELNRTVNNLSKSGLMPARPATPNLNTNAMPTVSGIDLGDLENSLFSLDEEKERLEIEREKQIKAAEEEARLAAEKEEAIKRLAERKSEMAKNPNIKKSFFDKADEAISVQRLEEKAGGKINPDGTKEKTAGEIEAERIAELEEKAKFETDANGDYVLNANGERIEKDPTKTELKEINAAKKLNNKRLRAEDRAARREYAQDDKSVSFGDYEIARKRNYKKSLAISLSVFFACVLAAVFYFVIWPLINVPRLPSGINAVLSGTSNGVALDVLDNDQIAILNRAGETVKEGEKVYYTREDFYITTTLSGNPDETGITLTTKDINAISIIDASVTSGDKALIQLNKIGQQYFGGIAIIDIVDKSTGNNKLSIKVFIDVALTYVTFEGDDTTTTDMEADQLSALSVQYQDSKKTISADAYDFYIGEYAKLKTKTSLPIDRAIFYRPVTFEVVSEMADGTNLNNESVLKPSPAGEFNVTIDEVDKGVTDNYGNPIKRQYAEGEFLIANYIGTAKVIAKAQRFLFETDNNKNTWIESGELELEINLPPIETNTFKLDYNNKFIKTYFNTPFNLPLDGLIDTLNSQYSFAPFNVYNYDFENGVNPKKTTSLIGKNDSTVNIVKTFVGSEFWNYVNKDSNTEFEVLPAYADINGKFINQLQITPPTKFEDWGGFAGNDINAITFPTFNIYFNGVYLNKNNATNKELTLNLTQNLNLQTSINDTSTQTQKVLQLGAKSYYGDLDLRSFVDINNLNTESNDIFFGDADLLQSSIYFRVMKLNDAGTSYIIDEDLTTKFIKEVDNGDGTTSVYFKPTVNGTYKIQSYLRAPYSLYNAIVNAEIIKQGAEIKQSASADLIEVEVKNLELNLTNSNTTNGTATDVIKQNFYDIFGANFNQLGSFKELDLVDLFDKDGNKIDWADVTNNNYPLRYARVAATDFLNGVGGNNKIDINSLFEFDDQTDLDWFNALNIDPSEIADFFANLQVGFTLNGAYNATENIGVAIKDNKLRVWTNKVNEPGSPDVEVSVYFISPERNAQNNNQAPNDSFDFKVDIDPLKVVNNVDFNDTITSVNWKNNSIITPQDYLKQGNLTNEEWKEFSKIFVVLSATSPAPDTTNQTDGGTFEGIKYYQTATILDNVINQSKLNFSGDQLPTKGSIKLNFELFQRVRDNFGDFIEFVDGTNGGAPVGLISRNQVTFTF